MMRDELEVSVWGGNECRPFGNEGLSEVGVQEHPPSDLLQEQPCNLIK